VILKRMSESRLDITMYARKTSKTATRRPNIRDVNGYPLPVTRRVKIPLGHGYGKILNPWV
jgi:hypothetical protein